MIPPKKTKTIWTTDEINQIMQAIESVAPDTLPTFNALRIALGITVDTIPAQHNKDRATR